MIQYTLSTEGFEAVKKLEKYTEGKCKDLEKFIPRKARESARLIIHLERRKDGVQKSCQLALQLPHDNLIAKHTAEHTYSALDIAAADIKRQLETYKSKHGRQGLRHKMARLVKRGEKTIS